MLKKCTFLCLFSLCAFKTGKTNYLPEPTPIFNLVAPLHHQLSVTGSFGELRPNHFHAGIDLRSQKGIVGDQILAAAQGFISKIKVDCKNYGNSLYIQHPSGYTTVYAHLSRFRPDIQERVRAYQYSIQQNEVEIEFGPEEFAVSPGDSIGYMGNTGDSRGAHLHFELRVTGTDEVLDPADFGLLAEDHIAPTVRRFKLCGFDLDGNTISERIIGNNSIKSKIMIQGDVFGMAVEAFDRNNTSWRMVGIKSLQMKIDHGLFYSWSMDRWSLDETKYINAHVDWRSQYLGRFHRCYKLQGNKFPIYRTVENDGFFYIGDGQEHLVELTISDASGNESSRSFTIQGTAFSKLVKPNQYPEEISCDKNWNYNFGFGTFELPSGCTYDNMKVRVDTVSNTSENAYSRWIGIKPGNEPLHRELAVAIRPEKEIPAPLMEKCFIGLKRGKSFVSIGGSWDHGAVRAGAKNLGYYALMMDTTPPHLVAKNFRYNMSGKKSMSFSMSDNIADITKNRPGIKYNAYIDGQWIVMQHDLKTHTLKHDFESWLGNGTHELLITLEDSQHNQSAYRYNFYY